MKGSTRKRGNTWYYCFDMGMVGGVRKRKERGGFTSKKEAEAALAKAMAAFTSGGPVSEPSAMSFADYLDMWMAQYVRMNLKYNTQLDYKRVIDNHIKPALGTRPLRLLDAGTLQQYINGLKLRGYARTTVANILGVLSGSLRYAVVPLGLIPHSPCEYVKVPKYENKRAEVNHFIPKEDMAAVLARFPEGDPFHLPILIGYYTGLRISECFGLTWDRIDLNAQTVTVDRQVIKRGARSLWYFTSPKTPSSVRVVSYGPALQKALLAARRAQQAARLQHGKQYTEHYLTPEKDEKGDTHYQIVPMPRGIDVKLQRVDMVCVRADGTRVSPDSFKYVCRIARHELHIEFNYHSLRHTHATMLIEAGVDPKTVQERLGHADIQTTYNRYVHNTHNMQQRAVDLFERAAQM